VEEVANHRPDYSFVMVGPALGKQKFPRAPNLYYLGLKPYKLIPSYLHYSDVLIIPFRVSSMTQACNPIKLWEYLATGKPIVSTNLPEVSNIKEVNIAQTPDEFSSSLEAALRSGNNRLAKTKRIEVARQNDWSQRAHEILAIINQNR
jgi:glycosyltransferase involved in cell wall biosynthesis